MVQRVGAEVSYDDWRCTPPNDDDLCYLEEEPMSTAVSELKTCNTHIQNAIKSLQKAQQCAVLSRSRKRRLDEEQQDLYDIVSDILEELEVRQ